MIRRSDLTFARSDRRRNRSCGRGIALVLLRCRSWIRSGLKAHSVVERCNTVSNAGLPEATRELEQHAFKDKCCRSRCSMKLTQLRTTAG